MVGKQHGRVAVRIRLVSAALTCFLFAAVGPVAAGGTHARLSSASGRLDRLERHIAVAQAEATRQQARLLRVLGQLTADESSYTVVESRMMDLRNALAAAQAQYVRSVDTIDQRAAQVYMQGPLADVEAVLGSGSFSELTDRVQFISAISQYDAEVAASAGRAQAALHQQVQRRSGLLAQEAQIVRRTDQHRQQLDLVFRSEQSALQTLADARARALQLVQTLKATLTAQQRTALGSGMPITFGDWAGRFLAALGALTSHGNLVAMVAWESAEGTMASWNPLATTYDMPGATLFNSVGVKNYRSLAQGVQATIGTLQAPGHGYQAIVGDLVASTDPMTTAQAINASDWCHGCAGGQYVVELVPVVEQYFSSYSGR
jgi:peptidoglycan hydrolase CwlO-like protein